MQAQARREGKPRKRKKARKCKRSARPAGASKARGPQAQAKREGSARESPASEARGTQAKERSAGVSASRRRRDWLDEPSLARFTPTLSHKRDKQTRSPSRTNVTKDRPPSRTNVTKDRPQSRTNVTKDRPSSRPCECDKQTVRLCENNAELAFSCHPERKRRILPAHTIEQDTSRSLP